jgi:excisionase family DNA binding protein
LTEHKSGLHDAEIVSNDAKGEGVNATLIAPRLLTVREVAEYLGVPVQTLYTWRSNGIGPRGSKVGRHVRYRPEDVEAWLEQKASP